MTTTPMTPSKRAAVRVKHRAVRREQAIAYYETVLRNEHAPEKRETLERTLRYWRDEFRP